MPLLRLASLPRPPAHVAVALRVAVAVAVAVIHVGVAVAAVRVRMPACADAFVCGSDDSRLAPALSVTLRLPDRSTDRLAE
jgi:hypothetical protein